MLYRKVAKDVYCWAVAILFVGLIWLGWYMVGLHFYDRWFHDSLMIHKSLGMILSALVIAKIGWRVSAGIYRTPAAYNPAVRGFQRVNFYLLMAAINLTGYLISTSSDTPVSVFRVFGVPAVFQVGKKTLDAVIWFHYYLAYGSVFLILTHALMRLWPRIKVRYFYRWKELRRSL